MRLSQPNSPKEENSQTVKTLAEDNIEPKKQKKHKKTKRTGKSLQNSKIKTLKNEETLSITQKMKGKTLEEFSNNYGENLFEFDRSPSFGSKINHTKSSIGFDTKETKEEMKESENSGDKIKLFELELETKMEEIRILRLNSKQQETNISDLQNNIKALNSEIDMVKKDANDLQLLNEKVNLKISIIFLF